jgi:aspartyl protease family protein
MGMQDRDGYRDPHQQRASPSTGLTRGLKLAPLGIILFWALIMGGLYLAMNHYLQPRQAVVSANGDLVIPRDRDGHFYAQGMVNGRAVKFLIDTGASLVTVSESFARQALLPRGEPATFNTANGDLRGRIVSGMPVSVGPVRVSNIRVGVGLVGQAEEGAALLGQSFLSKFDVLLQKDQMVLRPRAP